MHWSDVGVVLGARRHGESSVILELMSREHGRSLGLVHGGRSRRLQAVIQAGNTVQAVWRARLEDHLGTFTVEPVALRSAALIGSPVALCGLALLGAHLRLLPERDPHRALYDAAMVLVEHLADRDLAPALMVRFEIALLAELGFGLDLSSCAATGATRDLTYVSPRTGRAVSAEAGEPYRHRLLGLPAFLRGASGPEGPDEADLVAGFTLTEHFLRVHLYEPRGLALPQERDRFIALARRGP